MSQKKLHSFFKPIQKTAVLLRSKPANCNTTDDEPAAKIRKLEENTPLQDENRLSDSNCLSSQNSTISGSSDSSKENNGKSKQCTIAFEPPNEVIVSEIAKLSSELEVVDPKIGPSWYKALKPEFKKPYFAKLSDFVTNERKIAEIYPPSDKVWSWTKECSLDNIKVVILGQDPYHNPGQAHGLCFSVLPPVAPPPSLLNMYKELTSDIEGFIAPKHGYLVGWARQGVLLLNACLTVRKNMPNSHKDRGWEQLTSAAIKYLNDHKTGIVFMLWGAYAQKKADFVDKKKHCVLKTVHPSPLSASRGWFGCKHFSKCNDYLTSVGKRPIDWNRLPAK